MKSIVARVLVVSIALGVAVFALAGTAGASHVKVDISVPTEATGGGPAAVQVRLSSADQGLPVANAAVTLYASETFGQVSGDVELGQTVTDQNGVAVVRFHPMAAGDHEIRIQYVTPGAKDPEVTTASLTLPGVASQLYQSSAGVRIPGLNVWLLIAVVATVWAILLSVAVRVIAIAHAGSDEVASEPARVRRADAQARAH